MMFLKIMYLIVALGISLFYGFKGAIIFSGEKYYKELTKAKKFRKFIIYFFPTMLGFSILYYLIDKAVYCVTSDPRQYNLLNIIDILLLTLVLLSVPGYLADVIYRLSKRMDRILAKLLQE